MAITDWTRNETILALDLYFREREEPHVDQKLARDQLGRNLSLLPERSVRGSKRKAAAILSKLGDFDRKDSSGNRANGNSELDKAIWFEFENKRDSLRSAAASILRDAAENFLRRELPDLGEYGKAMDQLAISINYAREIGASNWSVTLQPAKNELYCMNIEVVVLVADLKGIRVSIVEPTSEDKIKLGSLAKPTHPYKVDPSMAWEFNASFGEVERWNSLILPYHKEWLAKAGLKDGRPRGNPYRRSHSSGIVSLVDERVSSAESQPRSQLFDPEAIREAKKRMMAEIVQRQGQGRFREQLINAYHGSCAVTGYEVLEALEAAHIVPYLGPETNTVVTGSC